MRAIRKSSYGYNTFPTWALVAVLCFFAITIGIVPVQAIGSGYVALALAVQAGVVVLAFMALKLARQALRERIEIEPGRVLYYPANGAKPEVIENAEIEALESQFALRLDPLYDLVYRGGQRVNIDPLLLSRWEELSGELRRRAEKNNPRSRHLITISAFGRSPALTEDTIRRPSVAAEPSPEAVLDSDAPPQPLN